MKQRFILFRRKNTFYCEDTTTGRQTSLRTCSEAEAKTLIQVRNESVRQPTLNLQIARTYLAASDSGISNRTWQHALDALIATKKGSTQERWLRASRDPAIRPLLERTIIETQSEQFLSALNSGTVSTNVHLRKFQNFCLDIRPRPSSSSTRKCGMLNRGSLANSPGSFPAGFSSRLMVCL